MVIQRVSDFRSIRQEHAPKGALVLVVVVGLDGDFIPEGKFRGRVLGVPPLSLALLRAVDAAEADTFSMVAVQHFDGVAVNYSDDSSGVVGGQDKSWDEQGCQ